MLCMNEPGSAPTESSPDVRWKPCSCGAGGAVQICERCCESLRSIRRCTALIKPAVGVTTEGEMAKKTRSTRRADPCARIRARLGSVQEQIQQLRDFLPEAPPAERKRIQAAIKRLQALAQGLVRDLARCEKEHEDDR